MDLETSSMLGELSDEMTRLCALVDSGEYDGAGVRALLVSVRSVAWARRDLRARTTTIDSARETLRDSRLVRETVCGVEVANGKAI